MHCLAAKFFTKSSFFGEIFCMKVPPFLILNVGRLLSFAFMFWFLTTNYHVWAPDPAMYLQSANLILDGLKPYVDFIDINPPLIMYLSIIPVVLAKALHISEFVALALCTMALIFVCAILLQNVIRGSGIFSRKETIFIDYGFIFISVMMTVTYCYAQREHLFAICFLPYVFLRGLRNHFRQPVSIFIAIAIGLLCGLMSALKPHFLILILSFELCLFYWDKKNYSFKQPEVLSIILINVIYTAHFLFLPIEVRKGFFEELVPLVIRNYNSMDETSIRGLKNLKWHFLQYFLIFGSVFFLWPYLTEPFKRIQKLLISTSIVAFVLFVLQHKGWPYQLVVSFALIMMSFVIAIVSFYKILGEVDRKTSLLCFVNILLAMLALYLPINRALKNALGFKVEAYIPELSNAKAYLKSTLEQIASVGDKVLILSVNPSYSYPLFNHMGYRTGSRYLFLFPMAFFNNKFLVDEDGPYPYKSFEQMPAEEQLFIRRLQEDVLTNKPKVLAFISTPRDHTFLPKNFDIFKYFEVNGSWANWNLLYELAYSKEDIAIYKRKSL